MLGREGGNKLTCLCVCGLRQAFVGVIWVRGSEGVGRTVIMRQPHKADRWTDRLMGMCQASVLF